MSDYLVLYWSSEDHDAASLLASRFSARLMRVRDLAGVPRASVIFIVGGQGANPLFAWFVSHGYFEPLTESDAGFVRVQLHRSAFASYVGVAGWSREDTFASARWVVDHGVPSESVRVRIEGVPVGKGWLVFNVTPSDARVFVRGVSGVFHSGEKIELGAGRWVVDVTRDGYYSHTKGYDVSAGETKTVSVVLQKIPSEGVGMVPHLLSKAELKDRLVNGPSVGVEELSEEAKAELKRSPVYPWTAVEWARLSPLDKMKVVKNRGELLNKILPSEESRVLTVAATLLGLVGVSVVGPVVASEIGGLFAKEPKVVEEAIKIIPAGSKAGVVRGIGLSVKSLAARLVSQCATNPLICVFASTEIPQLFTMTQFARHQLLEEAGGTAQQLSFRLKKYEDSLKSQGYTFRDQVKANDLEGAETTLGQMKKTLEDYGKVLRENRERLAKTGDYEPAFALFTMFSNAVKAQEKELEKKAQLLVMSNVPMEKITVDGKTHRVREGYTAWTVTTGIGEHTVIVEATGFKRHEEKVNVRGITGTVLKVVLEPEEAVSVGVGAEEGAEEVVEEKGSVEIASQPEGARVFIGGKDTGEKTPVILELKKGTYTVKLRLEGYEDKTTTVTVKAGKIISKTVKLEKKPVTVEKGSIRIETTPEGASVTLDEEDTGKTTPVTIENVEEGLHLLRLKLEGYVTSEEQVRVKKGEESKVSVKMEKRTGPRLWKVNVESTPPGAKIVVNDAFTGRFTPNHVILEPGEYTVRVELEGYEPAEKKITLEA